MGSRLLVRHVIFENIFLTKFKWRKFLFRNLYHLVQKVRPKQHHPLRKSTQSAVSGVAKKTTSSVNKVAKKLQGLCNPESIIPCITALTIIAYIVIVTPATVLDLFSSKLGKAVSMSVVLVALLFDLKMGVMLGLAVILSISLASVNKDLFETFADVPGTEATAPVGAVLDNTDASGVDASGVGVPESVPPSEPSMGNVAIK